MMITIAEVILSGIASTSYRDDADGRIHGGMIDGGRSRNDSKFYGDLVYSGFQGDPGQFSLGLRNGVIVETSGSRPMMID